MLEATNNICYITRRFSELKKHLAANDARIIEPQKLWMGWTSEVSTPISLLEWDCYGHCIWRLFEASYPHLVSKCPVTGQKDKPCLPVLVQVFQSCAVSSGPPVQYTFKIRDNEINTANLNGTKKNMKVKKRQVYIPTLHRSKEVQGVTSFRGVRGTNNVGTMKKFEHVCGARDQWGWTRGQFTLKCCSCSGQSLICCWCWYSVSFQAHRVAYVSLQWSHCYWQLEHSTIMKQKVPTSWCSTRSM